MTPKQNNSNINHNNNSNVTSNSTKPGTTGKIGVWYWKNDQGNWIIYDNNITSKLEQAWSTNDRKAKIQVDPDRYVDLQNMWQCRYDDRTKIRTVKREETLITNKNNNNNNNNNNNYNNYNNNNNKQTTSSSYQTNKPMKPNGIVVENSTTTTTTKTSNFTSTIPSTISTISKNKPTYANSGKVKWYWQKSKNDYEEYKEEISNKIEEAWVAKSKTIKIDDERFIDFEFMLQRRYDNNSKHRYIKREGPIPGKKELTQSQKEKIEKNRLEALKKQQQSKQLKLDFQPINSNKNKNNNEEINNKEEVVTLDSDDTDDEEPLVNKKIQVNNNNNNKYVTLKDIVCWEDEGSIRRYPSPFTPNSDINKKLSLWKGNIVTLQIDSIVNAAKPSLLGGGGIDGAIHKAAGSGLLKECMLLGGCEVGDSKITGGHKIPSNFIIHTVGPIGEKKKKLESCYKTSLDLVELYNLKSIAFCCISTGIYGYPKEPAAHVALNSVRQWLLQNHSIVDRIIFCMFADDEEEVYEELLPQYFPRSKDTVDQPDD